jgi:hypothetical protein
VIGTVVVRFGGERSTPGILGWGFDDPAIGHVDGLPTGHAAAPGPAPRHPNGIVGIDHVVVMSPDLDRTTAAFVAAGFEIRRTREAELGGGAWMRQAFIRAGDVVLELVGPVEADPSASTSPSRFWGLAVVSGDLDATVDFFGDACAPAKPAVQEGRRIATLDTRRLGLGMRVAIMS